MADSTDRNEEEKPDKYIVLDLNLTYSQDAAFVG